jgi:hypothetical protein
MKRGNVPAMLRYKDRASTVAGRVIAGAAMIRRRV